MKGVHHRCLASDFLILARLIGCFPVCSCGDFNLLFDVCKWVPLHIVCQSVFLLCGLPTLHSAAYFPTELLMFMCRWFYGFPKTEFHWLHIAKKIFSSVAGSFPLLMISLVYKKILKMDFYYFFKLCVGVFLCGHTYRCRRRPEVLDPLDLESPDMGAGKGTLCKDSKCSNHWAISSSLHRRFYHSFMIWLLWDPLRDWTASSGGKGLPCKHEDWSSIPQKPWKKAGHGATLVMAALGGWRQAEPWAP